MYNRRQWGLVVRSFHGSSCCCLQLYTQGWRCSFCPRIFLHISELPHHTGTVRWQCHNICIILACIQRSQNFASIDGRGGKWRIKSNSLIDPLNIASSRNSWLGHGTKVLPSILEDGVTRKQRWKPVWKTALPWPHAWELLPTSNALTYDVTKTRPCSAPTPQIIWPPTSTKNKNLTAVVMTVSCPPKHPMTPTAISHQPTCCKKMVKVARNMSPIARRTPAQTLHTCPPSHHQHMNPSRPISNPI